MNKLFTLCFLHQDNKVLLGKKKRGFGAGHWNGFGGKVQPNEDIEVATRREFAEEAGIEVGELFKHGIIIFEFENNPELWEVHVFSASTYTGTITESEEMLPEWFDRAAVPFKEMWADDEYWFSLMFAGKKFDGYFLFPQNGNRVITHTLTEK